MKVGILIAASSLLPLLIGLLAVLMLWPTGPSGRADLALKSALGVGLGLGFTSGLYFLWLVVVGPSRGFVALEIAALVGLVAGLIYRRRQGPAAKLDVATSVPNARSVAERLLSVPFALISASAFVTFIAFLVSRPHGRWDARAIWNMRARFLFRGDEAWMDAFSGFMSWTHLDYPLLVPGAIARSWRLAGSDTTAVPALVALLFAFATVGLLVASLALLRSRSQGFLAGIVLLASQTFIWHGASQYADIPMGFFVLATLVCIVFSERVPSGAARLVFLAGLMAGLAAWTKNEGTLFALVLVASYLIVVARASGWKISLRRGGFLVGGIVPTALLLIGFKMWLAPGNDLLSSLELSSSMDKLIDPLRYGYVIRRFAAQLFDMGDWLLSAPVILGIYMVGAGGKVEAVDRPGIAAASLTLSLLLMGYFLVYVITPHELTWHIDTSLYRLALHVWPSMLFVFFMLARTPEEAGVIKQS